MERQIWHSFIAYPIRPRYNNKKKCKNIYSVQYRLYSIRIKRYKIRKKTTAYFAYDVLIWNLEFEITEFQYNR